MNEKKKNPAVQIWYVAYPFLFYYAVSIIVMSLCTMIMGDSQAHFGCASAGHNDYNDSVYDAFL